MLTLEAWIIWVVIESQGDCQGFFHHTISVHTINLHRKSKAEQLTVLRSTLYKHVLSLCNNIWKRDVLLLEVQ